MRIGIDLSIAAINQAGTGIYIKRLVEAFEHLQKPETFVYFSVKHQRDMSAPKTYRTRINTVYRDLIWMHTILPLQTRRAGVKVLHMPAGIIPYFPPKPVVLTILDTILFQTPERFPLWQRYYFQSLGPRSALFADRIITISEHSKLDIIRQFNVPPEKVTVTYLAAGSEFKPLPPDNIASVRQKYGLNQNFILTVGTIEPRKNLARILDSFVSLKSDGFAYQLVHVGPNGWLQENLVTKIKQLGIQKSVRFLGFLPIQDLVAVYNAATLFVYPSLYEGFGLPVLEAMACGCPVVTSNTSSMPEVAGDAAILVDPSQVGAITKGITDVLNNSYMAADLRERGLLQCQRFSWYQTALETLNVYREVAGK